MCWILNPYSSMMNEDIDMKKLLDDKVACCPLLNSLIIPSTLSFDKF